MKTRNKVPLRIKKTKLKKIKMTIKNILKPLYEIDGYLASAIFDIHGDVIIQHNNSKYNIDLIGENIVEVVQSAIKTLINSKLGKCNFIQINSEKGIFVTEWAVEDQSLVTVLIEPNANIGMTKLIVSKIGKSFAV